MTTIERALNSIEKKCFVDALWIFKNKLEQEALEIIISSKRVDSKTILKAQKILRAS